jgi:hypothetical protein
MKKSFEMLDHAVLTALQDDREILALHQDHEAMQVHGLLNALKEVEEFAGRLSETQFNTVIQDAVLACGFADELDAWYTIMDHLQSGTCRESSCIHRTPAG